MFHQFSEKEPRNVPNEIKYRTKCCYCKIISWKIFYATLHRVFIKCFYNFKNLLQRKIYCKWKDRKVEIVTKWDVYIQILSASFNTPLYTSHLLTLKLDTWKIASTVPRTSRILSSQNCNYSSVLSTFKYNSGKTINLLLLDHFCPLTYRRVQNESDELSYTVIWSLVTVRNQLPAQVVKCIIFRKSCI